MVSLKGPIGLAIVFALMAEVLADEDADPVQWAFGGAILGVILEALE